jgi:hypothetical protein
VDVRSENAKKFREMFDKGQVPEAAAAPDKAAQVRIQSLVLFAGSMTPCASPSPQPYIFSDCSFLVRHPVNRDDWHLLDHAMSSAFIIPVNQDYRYGIFLSKRRIGFSLWIKLKVQNP